MKKLPRGERKCKQLRVFSTNFKENIVSSGIKCWVPLEDYRNLEQRYIKLVQRRSRLCQQVK